MFCDLHTHSVFSDGTDTPEELLRRAEELGLSALALTDHNSAAGLPRFLAAFSAGKKLSAEEVEALQALIDANRNDP